MIKVYLWANALIYLLFVLWCTVKKEQTSLASGFTGINNSGWSEYLVIYGGLQLGLAAFFVYLALHSEFYNVGLIFSLLLYFPIVIYRVISIYKFWPVSSTTLVIGGMEILLLTWSSAILILSKT